MQESELIRLSKKLDQIAFRDLMLLYKNRIYSYVLNNLRDNDIADDVFQEILIKTWKAIPNYDEQQKFASWIFTITHNSIIDAVRKYKKHPSVDALINNPGNSDPAKDYELFENERLIEKAIHSLDKRQREVFLMRQSGELKFREIAKILNKPINTVLSDMNYAMKKIKKFLKEEHEFKRT